MRVIIAGSRTANRDDVAEALVRCPFAPRIREVVSGTAAGADTHGEALAQQSGIPVKRFPADWARYGRRAGHLRNVQMAENADALIAVWDGKSPGTRDMIRVARRFALQVYVFTFYPTLETPDAP